VDPDEPGISNVVVQLYGTNGAYGTNFVFLLETTTDNNGYYLFQALAPDSYYVKLPATNFAVGGALEHYWLTSPSVTTNDQVDDDNNGSQAVLNGDVISPLFILRSGHGPLDTTTETGRGNELDNAVDEDGDMTMDFGFTAPVTIGNYVWVDLNGNGVQDGGEPGMDGVTVTLYRTNHGVGTLTQVATTNSASGGAFSFSVVPAGDFVVSFGLPSGYSYTTFRAGSDTSLDCNALPGNGQTPVFTLTSGQTDNSVDAGYYQPTSISGAVLLDLNGYGTTAPADTTGISGVTITLQTNGATVVTTTTDSSGNYSFANLPPGSYTVVQTLPGGYLAATATSLPVTLVSGTPSTGNTFLDAQPVTIGDKVWVDTNGNGVQDSSEPGLTDVAVTLYRASHSGGTLTQVATRTTASGGAYSFTGLLPGDFVIGFGLPSGYAYTLSNAGSDTNLDSNALPGDGKTAVFAVTSGETDNSVDAGYYQPGMIGSQVWADVNDDGLLNNGETGINGVTVQLYAQGKVPGTDGPDATTTTSTVGPNEGIYSFANLRPGNYFVHIPTPPVSAPLASTTVVSSDNRVDSDNNGSQSGGIGTAVTSPVITLSSGETDNTVDFGFTAPVTIGNLVWVDLNGNGVQGSG
jgi:hypothetical protein